MSNSMCWYHKKNEGQLHDTYQNQNQYLSLPWNKLLSYFLILANLNPLQELYFETFFPLWSVWCGKHCSRCLKIKYKIQRLNVVAMWYFFLSVASIHYSGSTMKLYIKIVMNGGFAKLGYGYGSRLSCWRKVISMLAEHSFQQLRYVGFELAKLDQKQ